jgi:hypothetical protein
MVDMEPKPIPFYKQLIVDLDGTIFKDAGDVETTFNNRTELVPMEEAARYTQQLCLDGYKLFIQTCRPHWHCNYLEDQLKRNGIYYTYLLFDTKPRGDIYLDNKGMHFTSWKKAYEDIELRRRQAMGLQQPFTSYEKQLQKLKIKYLPKTNNLVMDTGCGDGSVFQDTDYRLHGYDIDTRALELCRQVKNYELCTNDGGELLEIDKYEIVTLLGVLEHVDHPEALLNHHRRANQLYITVPNAGSFHRMVGKEAGIISSLVQLSDQDRAIGHKHYFSYPKFEHMIEDFAGANHFDIKQIGTVGFKIASNEQMEPFSEIALHLQSAAEKAGVAGHNLPYGAEIFAHLVKR